MKTEINWIKYVILCAGLVVLLWCLFRFNERKHGPHTPSDERQQTCVASSHDCLHQGAICGLAQSSSS